MISMDRILQERKKQYANQYSILKNRASRDESLNCFSNSLKVQKQKENFSLPKVSSSRKERTVQKLKDDLKVIKQKLLSQQRFKSLMSKQHNHHPHFFNIPLPFPMQQPQIPFSFPVPYPPHQKCSCNSPKKKRRNQNRKKKQKKQKKEIVSEKPKRKIKSLRIYAYAVYFTIFLKNFSRKFTNNRRNWFADRYLKPTQKSIIYQGSQKFLQKLYQIDFYEMIEEAKYGKQQGIKKQTINWQEETNTALIPVSRQKLNKNKQAKSKSEQLINLVEILFEKINLILSDPAFMAEYHQVFSAGSLNQSFMISNLYLPQETPFIFIHPDKGYLKIGYQEEIQLLSMKLMIKMVIFNYLLGVQNSKSWNHRLEKKYNLNGEEIEEIWNTARTLGIYLYVICRQFYILGLRNTTFDSNFGQIANKFGIRAAKTLEDAQKLNQQTQKIKKTYHLINNLKGLDEVEAMILRSSKLGRFKQTVKEKMVQILANLYEKLKEQEREVYTSIWNMTINTPFLILSQDKKSKETEKKQKIKKLLQPREHSNRNLGKKSTGRGILLNDESNSSLSSRNRRNNVRFDDSSSKDYSSMQRKTEPFQYSGILNSSNAYRININGQYNEDLKGSYLESDAKLGNFTKFEEQKQNRMKNSINMKSTIFKNSLQSEGRMKSYQQMFNMDTINERAGINKQDRIRQRFRNILSHQKGP